MFYEAFTQRVCESYHNQIFSRGATLCVIQRHSLSFIFPTHARLGRYCVTFYKLKIIHDGRKRSIITFKNYTSKVTGFFRCPLHLLTQILIKSGDSSTIISFQMDTAAKGIRRYSTKWKTNVYKTYSEMVSTRNLLMVAFYSCGATLSKSGRQNATFLKVPFPNVIFISYQCHTIGFSPLQKQRPESMPLNFRKK